MPYCPLVKVLALLAGPWMSRSFFISFFACFKFGTFSRNFSFGFSGRTTSVREKNTQIYQNKTQLKAFNWFS